MSDWQELKAERISDRLSASLRPCLRYFHELCWLGLLPAHSCRRRRGLRSSHIGAPIQFEPIAWREHSPLAAKLPVAGLGGWATGGAVCLLRSARRPRRTAKPHMQGVGDFVACAVNRYIASAGTLTFGAAVPTRMRSGTVLVWSLGSSGMRPIARFNCCGASKVGGALKAAGGCGGMPKLTIASRFSASGANTEIRPGRVCSIFGVCQTFR
jgi:hypothetical protein